jgi:GNAT superfamily N-acetyltransferase
LSAEIRLLSPPQIRQRVPDLAEVLVDCVHGGASVEFMEPFSVAEAVGYFAEIAESVQSGERALFAAIAEGRAVGCVQLAVRLPANQPHRAAMSMLLVHRSRRGQGIGAGLMNAAERHAVALGKTLITLDTSSVEAEWLFTRQGYAEAGAIPNFTLLPDGRPTASKFFWKAL